MRIASPLEVSICVARQAGRWVRWVCAGPQNQELEGGDVRNASFIESTEILRAHIPASSACFGKLKQSEENRLHSSLEEEEEEEFPDGFRKPIHSSEGPCPPVVSWVCVF